MNRKKRTTEEFDLWSPCKQDTYQTGSTRPPKSYGGVIAVLLVLVIFLCGISTALGLMNIRLFRQLNALSAREESPVAFSQAAETTGSDVSYSLGFTAKNIPEIWSLYQDLPRGIYITQVDGNSDAAAKGIAPGDILMDVDGENVTDTALLNQLLTDRQEQSAVQLTVFRNGQTLSLTVNLQ